MSSTDKPFLVINADDFGWFAQRDKGIIEAFESGAISSSSAIANGNCLESSLEEIKDKPFGIGLHINLTDGPPIYQIKIEDNTLIGKYLWYFDGADDQVEINGFHGLFPLQSLIKLGKIKDIDIENEIRAQITRFIMVIGKLPTHVDGHKHIQMIPQIANILARIMTTEFNIYKIRFSKDDNEILSKEQESQFSQSIKIYQSYGIQSTDYFIGKFPKVGFTKVSIMKSLNSLKEKSLEPKQFSVEMMCHVGYPSIVPPKTFSSSQQRVKELRTLQDEKIKEYISSNYSLVSYDYIDNNIPRPVKSIKELFLISDKQKVILINTDIIEKNDCFGMLDSMIGILKNQKDVFFVQTKSQNYEQEYLNKYLDKINQVKSDNIDIAKRIIFIHYQDENQRLKSLKEVDIYISYSSTQNNSEQLLEAMSSQILCVNRDNEYHKEIIEDQITGFSFSNEKQLQDKCLLILQDKVNLHLIKENATKKLNSLLKFDKFEKIEEEEELKVN